MPNEVDSAVGALDDGLDDVVTAALIRSQPGLGLYCCLHADEHSELVVGVVFRCAACRLCGHHCAKPARKANAVDGAPVRTHFRFTNTGKISFTACAPIRAAA